ncbi:hypothetical protein DB88DRAFT_512804 [Papiliotrema laurentii]|uniref:Fe2OG dioxygenase domain-containing protein n=1 Tax=Papiliotrema laurentii TaxID=5418 RepID=A0AAD9CT74_PAPLA|nr:hypothetical protein DB88DRAFT_512804 [Papiliotrema laurentii]
MSSPTLSSGSFNSLFDEAPEPAEPSGLASSRAGSTYCEPLSTSPGHPSISGLYVFPSLLDPDVSRNALETIALADYFVGGTRDQVMFFVNPRTSTLPDPCSSLISHLSDLLRPILPSPVLQTVFNQDLGRQAILNLYAPGQGISPHTDLPDRYADGILGVSICGGATMRFAHPQHGTTVDVYLAPRSVYVMVGEARWEWTHGIEGKVEDEVEGRTVLRDVRVSATFRWMKPGADVLS